MIRNIGIKRYIHDRSGAAAIEYGIIAGLVAVSIIFSISLVGSNLNDVFDSVVSVFDGEEDVSEPASEPERILQRSRDNRIPRGNRIR